MKKWMQDECFATLRKRSEGNWSMLLMCKHGCTSLCCYLPRLYYSSEGEGPLRSKRDTHPVFTSRPDSPPPAQAMLSKSLEFSDQQMLCLCWYNPLSLVQRVANYGLPGTVPILYLEVLHPPKPQSQAKWEGWSPYHTCTWGPS